jgi:DNA repair photolyase
MEHRYGLTRDLLAALAESELTVSILTKSDLVLRDVDLLRRLPGCTWG